MSTLTLRSGRQVKTKNASKLPQNQANQKKSSDQNQKNIPQPQSSPPPPTNRQPPIRMNQLRSSLEDFYTNLQNPLAYSGNKSEILNTLEGFSLHRPRRKIFPRRLTFVPNIFHTIYVTGSMIDMLTNIYLILNPFKADLIGK